MEFSHDEGTLEGIYKNAGEGSPIVVIVNGHNGFYNYGMFPHIQSILLKNGISCFSFNFSHGGVISGQDTFEELDKYEKNCMRLEVKDTITVLQNVTNFSSNAHPSILILAHSLGGVPAVFSTTQATRENISISGLILLSCVQQLNFWPSEMMNKWEKDKVYYQLNNRTKQLLPHGEEFLSEILSSEESWNVKKEIRKIKCPVLIIHGGQDESVPVEHAHALFEALQKNNTAAYIKIIQSATHTYNTRHPFEGSSVQLDEMLREVMNFIKSA